MEPNAVLQSSKGRGEQSVLSNYHIYVPQQGQAWNNKHVGLSHMHNVAVPNNSLLDSRFIH